MNHIEFLNRFEKDYTPVKSDYEKSREMVYTFASHFVEWLKHEIVFLTPPRVDGYFPNIFIRQSKIKALKGAAKELGLVVLESAQ